MYIKQMSTKVSRGSGGDYQKDKQTGVAPQQAIIKKMSRQVSHGSAGDYLADDQAGGARAAGDFQADEQAGVALLSCQLSNR